MDHSAVSVVSYNGCPGSAIAPTLALRFASTPTSTLTNMYYIIVFPSLNSWQSPTILYLTVYQLDGNCELTEQARGALGAVNSTV